MNKVTAALRARREKSRAAEENSAQQEVLQELFHDIYRSRRRIYHVNFVRGVYFGLGSALGGSVVIAIILWLLSLFINFPLIGDYFRDIQQAIQSSR